MLLAKSNQIWDDFTTGKQKKSQDQQNTTKKDTLSTTEKLSPHKTKRLTLTDTKKLSSKLSHTAPITKV